MIDLDMLRNDPVSAQKKLARRGFHLDLDQWKQLEQERKNTSATYEAIQAQRNRIAEHIGRAVRLGEAVEEFSRQGESLKADAELRKEQMDRAEKSRHDWLMSIPNIPKDEVPDGHGEADNVLREQYGEPQSFDFKAKTHDELGALHEGLDFEAASALSGSRFVVASGGIARLHRALIQFMIDTHVDEHGYVEVQTPYLVKASALEGTGQLPKFEEDLFKIERDGLYLIPTAEVPVTNLLARMEIKEQDLPLAYTCHTPCFRREAGSAGRDVKGLIRQHQFEKVELVRACNPETAREEFEVLLHDAQAILSRLGLPYRAMNLCAGDLGFSSERTVDLEVWLPGQNAWREISSVSTFGTFQARRMGARYKNKLGKRSYLATLNGSGVAAGRALVAVMENYQTLDGSIVVPEVLRSYMKGCEILKPPVEAKALKTVRRNNILKAQP